MERRITLAAVLVIPLATAGCAAVLVAAGATAGGAALVWHSGWLRGNIGEPVERVHRAARSALADFKTVIDTDELKAPSGRVEGILPDGRRVIVKTKALAEKETQVRVHVGFWGDEVFSVRVFEQVKKHL